MLVTIALIAFATTLSGDLERYSRAELDKVSPYLAKGGRSREGMGSAFVGTLADEWSSLAEDKRQAIATELVERLRTHGIREIMLYDDDRRLRIQALGEQPVVILAVRAGG